MSSSRFALEKIFELDLWESLVFSFPHDVKKREGTAFVTGFSHLFLSLSLEHYVMLRDVGRTTLHQVSPQIGNPYGNTKLKGVECMNNYANQPTFVSVIIFFLIVRPCFEYVRVIQNFGN